MSGLFDQFKEWYEKRHDYARAWKARTGGQVVATMCTYTPEEILIAANMLPVRVLGAHEPQNVTEPHIKNEGKKLWPANILPLRTTFAAYLPPKRSFSFV